MNSTALLLVLGLLGGAPAITRDRAEDLMTTGVSHALATRRAAQLRDVRYDLRLDVTGRDTAKGRVVVRFERVGSDDVILDFRGLSVAGAIANGRVVERLENSGAHLRIPAALLRARDNHVEIEFTSAIAPAGASIIRTHDAVDGADYLYTLLVPSDANALFPCFDQPDLKARVTLSLVAPRSWTALANGRAVGADTLATGAIVHRFAETDPLSTYLIAFAAGPWHHVAGSDSVRGTPVHAYVRASRAKEAENDTLVALNARAVRWFGDYFSVPFPFQKFDFMLAPAFPFGGMEHPGAVFYNEESFIYRERPTLPQLLGRQATIYHEVAHQWFGDYVTMRWFDDLWLKEGFATYMAAKMQAATDPTSNAWKSFYLRNKPAAYDVDATTGTTPVWQALGNLDQAKSNYGAIVYNKAPGVLKQLNYLVGEDAFRSGVSHFLKSHAYGNATWQELLAAVGTAGKRDLGAWGKQYILRPGMPVLEQQLTVRDGKIARLALVQRAAQPSVSGPGVWPMKVQLLIEGASGAPKRIPVEIRAETTVVSQAVGLPAPRYVFANDGDYGYGLVMLDGRSVAHLERNIGTVTDDFRRAMLWGAMWDLVREARLAPRRYVDAAVRELPNEHDEQIAPALVGRIVNATTRYLSTAQRDSVQPLVERTLLAGAADARQPYGIRKAQLDGYISVAQSREALGRLDAWLDSTSAAGIPLRAPTRWAIVTALVSLQAPTADARLATETRTDSTTEGRRRAFVAGAARPTAETKRTYFTRYFNDASLNEDWVTASLGAFNDSEHPELSLPYLTPALDTLPWVQRNRRIFFLGRWLGAFIGGHASAEALGQVDRFLAEHPSLPLDLRQKILQTRDDLERTVRIRRAYAGG